MKYWASVSANFDYYTEDIEASSEEEAETHREEMKAFLAHSKQSMSKVIARYL